MHSQKRYPISALAGFHVLSALANIANDEKLGVPEDDKIQNQDAAVKSEAAPVSYPLLA